MMKHLAALLIWLAAAPLALAQGGGLALSPPAQLAEAMAALRAGDWLAAQNQGDRAGPIGRDVIDWHWLREGLGDFDSVLNFLERHSDWPGLPYLKQQSESSLPLSGRAEDVVYFFGDDQPRTGRGAVALARAFAALGRTGDAEATAVLAWVNLGLTAEAEAQLLADYAEILAPLNVARLDMALWNGWANAARRAAARLEDAGYQALTDARLGLRRGAGNIDALLAAVPEDLQDDPGLAYERFRRLRSARQLEEATGLLLDRSATPERLGRPGPWARARRDIARDLMRDGAYDRAYAVAASHHLAEGSDYADLQWLSGYLALRYLDAPRKALEHFRLFRAAVFTPISLGRAGYWLGRAHEALDDNAAAAEAYAFGAQHQTSFYGLLAAERLGLPLDPKLTGAEVFPDISTVSFRRSSVFEAALLLQAAGERGLAERFLVHLGERLSRAQQGTMADVAFRLGEPHIALMIAKGAARQGLVLEKAYFPVVNLGVEPMPVPLELALAIARRESEFDPGVASGVGARGLMQLMPATAREVAGDLGLPYSADRLFTDPSYNATLGTAYLAGLIDRFGPSPILVAAGYNAGPGRPAQWIDRFGDPRTGAVDIVDWIELIPFDETRNYVMRVAETLPAYRARLTGETGRLSFTPELKGG